MKKNIALLLVASVALGSAGVALAKNQPAKPTKPAKAAKPKPAAPAASKSLQSELKRLGMTCSQASVQLQGTFAGAGDGFLAIAISKATGKAATLAGKQVALRLLASTRVTRNGPTIASKLKMGDRLNVVALTCSQGLVARTVTATAKKS
ncbi:MAG TPA: hypothetical protein VJT84_06145 [Gaiellaceae bacterium]|nr:hypothetical protein [Gaiellaceae bacterium]